MALFSYVPHLQMNKKSVIGSTAKPKQPAPQKAGQWRFHRKSAHIVFALPDNNDFLVKFRF
jgi:hypothetical protein